MAEIQAFVTVSTVHPNGSEDNGWIDWGWSTTMLHKEREDVEPVLSIDESDTEALADEVPDIIAEVVGVCHNNGAGTFYAEDAYVDMRTGVSYMYAIHFKRVDNDTETAWCPVEDGNLELD
ncbi:hypothetical protein SEA_LUCKYSOCKE_195 [Streptomyces phage LuckySocke]|jgi:hypothetical protein|nr:hypothetical protein SEA_ALONE_199 [Streptomyces phage Alone3]WPH58873.1 hypothetical protein SEA_LUCKYSOCKE_195 [Streptomyces phage LuckySocke]